ncbi:ROK family transcriptional regulator [Caldinitratiruptor microaerophilus]|uniref:Transcriptional regulator n=1 Tax=Caldinitratiruptor microaerophilus TaxID=671077 RepID=A0AA35CJF1_9FIRM|nr:ROK family transcriptional regulator [Caldinitratiruptor microaerophilus]BDG60404.1 transcriptional regulator [Caldinitratiruptor microaerophilus]
MPLSGKPRLIREINRTLILDVLRTEGPLSRAALAARTGVSAPAISRVVADLLESGWIREVGTGESTGGRRPVLLAVNPEAGFLVGLDVRRQALLGAVTNLEGRVVVRDREPVRRRGPALLDQVVAFARMLVERAGIPRERLLGVGAAVTGVSRDDGTVTHSPGLDWADVPLGATLAAALGCPAYVENDVNALLLGEQWQGAAVGARDAAAILVGTGGVGAAVLVGGHLYTGRSGEAGEIGSWLVGPPATAEPLEDVAAVMAWVRRWGAADLDPVEERSVEALLAALQAGDPKARAILDGVLPYLAQATANLVTLLNPELVVLGGEVLAVADRVVPQLQAAVDRHCPSPAPVVPARLGDLSALLGVVRGFLDRQRNSVTFVRHEGRRTL